MNTASFKTLKNNELQVVDGGVHAYYRIIGGNGDSGYVMLSNPWDWTVQLATGWLQRKKRK